MTTRVPTRRVSFAEAIAGLERHFAGGDVVESHYAAALSALFPEGEDFFVRSVRHYRDEITDPDLKRAVTGFIGQEAMHGREHRCLNERLAELGYPTLRIDRVVGRFLKFRERLLPPIANLAFTAAAEHFTATLAELVLTDERVRRAGGDGPVAQLLTWHALEESEHKAVAFDVYRAVGGGELLRVWTMRMLRYGFVLLVAAQVAVSLLGDPAAYRPGNLRRSWRRLRRSPLMSPELWRRLRDYERRGFHPDDYDARQLVERWREELFGDQGTLSPMLSVPA